MTVDFFRFKVDSFALYWYSFERFRVFEKIGTNGATFAGLLISPSLDMAAEVRLVWGFVGAGFLEGSSGSSSLSSMTMTSGAFLGL
jgi:hypothetical protein